MSRRRWLIIVPAFLFGIAALTAAALPFTTVRGHLDSFAGDGSADLYTPILHLRVRLGLAAAGVVAMLMPWLIHSCIRCLPALMPLPECDSQPSASLRSLMTDNKWPLLGMFLLSGCIRLLWLHQPMRFDEAYTWLNFASQPFYVGISLYTEPNNHVFHTLCVHLTTCLLGDSPWAIRLPAFLAGSFLAPMCLLLSTQLKDRRAGWIAGCLVATSSPLIEFSANARGYSLLLLVVIVCWLLLIRASRDPGRVLWFVTALLAAIGFWTVPVMLLPFSMLVLWLVLQTCQGDVTQTYRSARWRYVGIFLATSGITAAVLYTPVLLASGPGKLMANHDVQSLGWDRFFDRAWASAHNSAAFLLRDMPIPAQAILIAGCCAAWLCPPDSTRLIRRHMLISLISCVAIVLLRRVLPPPRVWLFLLPLAFVFSSTGISILIDRIRSQMWRRWMTITVILLAGWPLITTAQTNSIGNSTETGSCQAAEQIVLDLKSVLRAEESVIAAAPCSAPLVYYAKQHGVPIHHFDRPNNSFSWTTVVVSRTFPQSLRSVLDAMDVHQQTPDAKFAMWKEYPSAFAYRLHRANDDSFREFGDER